MKIVIAEPKTGKSYQTEIDDNKSKPLYGIRIGKEIDGSLVGLIGYKLVVTGGTDKDGFPMRTDVHGTERKKILIAGGTGLIKTKKGLRKKKTVRGNVISEAIAQINVAVKTQGNKTIPETLGIEPKEEKKKEGEDTSKQ